MISFYAPLYICTLYLILNTRTKFLNITGYRQAQFELICIRTLTKFSLKTGHWHHHEVKHLTCKLLCLPLHYVIILLINKTISCLTVSCHLHLWVDFISANKCILYVVGWAPTGVSCVPWPPLSGGRRHTQTTSGKALSEKESKGIRERDWGWMASDRGVRGGSRSTLKCFLLFFNPLCFATLRWPPVLSMNRFHSFSFFLIPCLQCWGARGCAGPCSWNRLSTSLCC